MNSTPSPAGVELSEGLLTVTEALVVSLLELLADRAAQEGRGEAAHILCCAVTAITDKDVIDAPERGRSDE